MRNAEQPKLIDHVTAVTLPMRGRMIHGKTPYGEIYEASQDYDIHGRVSPTHFTIRSSKIKPF